MDAFIVAARRTAVAPRGGAFREVEAHDLAAPVLGACLADAGLAPDEVDQVILGNALSGGGNVARLAALAAGLPESVPALTIDTQCCAGLDAILLAARLVDAGAAECVLAGGVESFSRAPLRAHRPKAKDEAPVFYDRPAFAPWPSRDPDPLQAMARLAERRHESRFLQANTSCDSHRKALSARERMCAEIVPLAGLDHDAFTRALNLKLCLRAPLVRGKGENAIDATGVAVEADAAAAVAVVSGEMARRLGVPSCEIVTGASAGCSPEQLYDGAVSATVKVFDLAEIDDIAELARVELMESTAVQFAANRTALGLLPDRTNVGGGALARGHPIGASGAILAVRLFRELVRLAPDDPAFPRHLGEAGSVVHMPARPLGLAAIAAAGGLGSALLLQRS